MYKEEETSKRDESRRETSEQVRYISKISRCWKNRRNMLTSTIEQNVLQGSYGGDGSLCTCQNFKVSVRTPKRLSE